MLMFKGLVCAVSILSAAALHPSRSPAGDAGAGARDPHESKVLQTIDTMYGVDGPFVGDGFPIRGIPGDELPWEVRDVKGRLDTDGHLTIKVRGLVFKDSPDVPVELRGKNDETQFRAAVSCWTEDGDHVATVNAITPGFPATVSGDSSIRATLSLPNPCVAPIVMVLAGSEDKWFAVTGFEAEGE
jgi:hypothetical protein